MSALKADDVARYLRDNPVFFEDHAELLDRDPGAAPARRAGDPALRPPDRLAARQDQSARGEARRADPVRRGERRHQREGAPARASRCSPRATLRDGAARAVLQPARGLRGPAREPAAVARRWASSPEFGAVERRARASSRPGWTRRSAARTPTSRPPAGSATPRRTSARSRSCRCASSTRPSACSRSRARICALLPRDGHAVPQAHRRDGERGAAALRLSHAAGGRRRRRRPPSHWSPRTSIT